MPAKVSKYIALSPRSRGITLIELLVVMVIISIVTAAALPTLTSGVEQRRVREAARLVGTYIGAARSRAIETGRPAGVMIQRFNGSNYALSLVAVDVPPPYAGDTAASAATINASGVYGTITGLGPVTGGVVSTSNPDVGWANLIRPGDIIQLGYAGRSYVLYGPTNPATIQSGFAKYNNLPLTTAQAPTTSAPWYLVATDGSGSLPTATSTTTGNGVPYRISRQPTKSAVQPLQLPEGTCIDLYFGQDPTSLTWGGTSGIGVNTAGLSTPGVTTGLSNPPFFGNVAPYFNPMITFGPTGSVAFTYYDNYPPQHLQSAMYLLIGRREGIADINPGLNSTTLLPVEPSNPPNIADTNNFWVAISPQTSQIITTENAGVTSGGVLQQPRSFVQAALSIGGR